MASATATAALGLLHSRAICTQPRVCMCVLCHHLAVKGGKGEVCKNVTWSDGRSEAENSTTDFQSNVS